MIFRGVEEEDEAKLNMDPMIDCVFQLILFFLVTTSFMKMEQDWSINLPTASQRIEVVNPPGQEIIVNVRLKSVRLQDNQEVQVPEYRVGNHSMTLAELLNELSRAKAVTRSKDLSVTIRGDKQIKWQHIFAVIERCGIAGIAKVRATAEVQET